MPSKDSGLPCGCSPTQSSSLGILLERATCLNNLEQAKTVPCQLMANAPPRPSKAAGDRPRHRVRPSIIPVRPSKRSGLTPNVQGSGRAGIAARLTRVHSYPYPSFLSHSWESLVIQFLASASFGKSFTCISGLSGNVTTTIQLCPAFMGRASNLISAPDLAMGRNMRPKL